MRRVDRFRRAFIIFAGLQMLALTALVALVGIFLALFARKKNTQPQWHLFRTGPWALITLQRHCLTCENVVPPAGHTALATSSIGVWVIEIAMNTPSRNRAIKAIKDMQLPVACRENNFVVIGPYKQRMDAVRVVRDLNDSYSIRG